MLPMAEREADSGEVCVDRAGAIGSGGGSDERKQIGEQNAGDEQREICLQRRQQQQQNGKHTMRSRDGRR